MNKKSVKSLILTIFFMFICLNRVYAANTNYDSYKIGDTVTYKGIDFYVIDNSDSNQDYVTLLKAEPLTVDEVNTYGNDHINRYTVSSLETAYNENGYGGMAYYTSTTCGLVNNDLLETGCKTDYASSEIKYVVDAWAKDKMGISNLKDDDLGYKARLITLDELTINLGYEYNNFGTLYPSTNGYNTPGWIYNGKYQYWTMSQKDDSNTKIWYVSFGGKLLTTGHNVAGIEVVRPVINLKKEVQQAYNYDYNRKTYQMGDIVNYKGTKYYVIKDASERDSTVTLLKAMPLTVSEVDKYGKGHVNMYMPEWNKKIIGYYEKSYSDNGYGAIAYYSSENCGYQISSSGYESVFSECIVEYEKSDVKHVLDNWGKDFLNDSDLAQDELGYKYRLITLDELINDFGYSVDDEGRYSYTANVPIWIYGDYKYFTMTPADDGNKSMIVVDRDGKISASTYNGVTTMAQEYFGTIRPVITLKKSTGNEVQKEVVSVPDTLLSMPILRIIVGTVLLIIVIVIIYLVLRKRHNKKTT